MTAEIAIMNKTAIALAADSAVTIDKQEGKKIYYTVNKLFMLSKYHPVGIMIFGNAEFMGIPWESIIKIFRKKASKQKFNTLKEYAKSFISFLDKNNSLFPASEQEKYFNSAIYSYFLQIKKDIDKKVQSKIDSGKKIRESQIKDVVTNIIKKHHNEWGKVDKLPYSPKNHTQTIIAKYRKIIKSAREEVFQKLTIPVNSYNQLEKICGDMFSKNRFPRGISGIVIAGFGNKETFPSLVSFNIEAIVNNKLKYCQDKSAGINFNNAAWIIAFAQSEMVQMFLEGIDPLYHRSLKGYLSELFDKYPDYIVEKFVQTNSKKKKTINNDLKKIGKDILNDFFQKMKDYSGKSNINPIMNAVAVLPKDELAAMAESLVNLTSFKRKISMDDETVGGPIDVAVISKGDGFVWIKRKHYFEKELNPYFFANYFQEDIINKRREK